MNKSQKEFETWRLSAISESDMIKHGNRYLCDDVNYDWQAWQASRAALVVELPQERCDAGERLMNQVRDELDSVGVKYK